MKTPPRAPDPHAPVKLHCPRCGFEVAAVSERSAMEGMADHAELERAVMAYQAMRPVKILG